ncbi:MAG TPA: dihydrofolate reductase family protein [Chryseolinea sp.]|nr:dihydrofolate reductase family protein [Chryseolinea sp.]
MRKIKLEVQLSIDGFMADQQGKTDWIVWNWGPEWTWDNELKQYHTELIKSADCLFLSRQVVEDGFITHWRKIAEDPAHSQYEFAQFINNAHKVVFSKTLTTDNEIPGGWENVEVSKWDIRQHIHHLKQQEGKDILVFGGASFVSSLIQGGYIDEYHLLINPVVLGKGLPIFNRLPSRKSLMLANTRTYSCGVTLMKYDQVREQVALSKAS